MPCLANLPVTHSAVTLRIQRSREEKYKSHRCQHRPCPENRRRRRRQVQESAASQCKISRPPSTSHATIHPPIFSSTFTATPAANGFSTQTDEKRKAKAKEGNPIFVSRAVAAKVLEFIMLHQKSGHEKPVRTKTHGLSLGSFHYYAWAFSLRLSTTNGPIVHSGPVSRWHIKPFRSVLIKEMHMFPPLLFQLLWAVLRVQRSASSTTKSETNKHDPESNRTYMLI